MSRIPKHEKLVKWPSTIHLHKKIFALEKCSYIPEMWVQLPIQVAYVQEIRDTEFKSKYIYAGAECDWGAVLPRAGELAVPPQHGQGGHGHGAAAGSRFLLQTSIFSHVWYDHLETTITLILHLYQTWQTRRLSYRGFLTAIENVFPIGLAKVIQETKYFLDK